MKTINFRPLRFEKKSGLIKVASYQSWRKVKTADYNAFNLNVDYSYKNLPDDDFVFDHKGNELFFPNYTPNDIKEVPVNMTIGEANLQHENWRTHYMYSCNGLDVDGVPVFSHKTIDAICEYKKIDEYEPLTVSTVKMWFGWFLYNLNQANLIK